MMQQQQLLKKNGPNNDEEEDEPMDFAYVPFQQDDDEEEQENPLGTTPKNDVSSLLRLSTADSSLEVSGLATPGFLDDSQDEEEQGEDGRRLMRNLPTTVVNDGDEEESTTKRIISPTTKTQQQQRRRKRRKVIVDNDHTELSSEHIKAMLADTSDIVKRMIHPFIDDDDEEENDVDAKEGRTRTTRSSSSIHFVPILTQPFLADDGHLHPELIQLWQNNFYRALERPCPFEKQEIPDDIEQTRQVAAEDEEDEEGASKSSELEEVRIGTMSKNKNEGEEEEEPDDFAPPPMDDDEEEEDNPINPPMDLKSEEEDDEEEVDPLGHAASIGDLGFVNEFQLDDEGEEDDEDREAVGDHVGTKWHKHTVMVLKLLQNRIRTEEDDDVDVDDNEDVDDEDDDDASRRNKKKTSLPTSLEFGDLAKNVNRRTAASCFIECLVRMEYDKFFDKDGGKRERVFGRECISFWSVKVHVRI